MRASALVAAALAASVAVGASAGATAKHARASLQYTVIGLGTLGGSASAATGVNRSGQVVGYSDIAGDTASHAFLWSKGAMTDLGTLPGGTNSRANAINDKGQIAGVSDALTPSTGVLGFVVAPQAFLYDNGRMIDLDSNVPAVLSPASWAYGIDEAGNVVGDILDASMDSHAFLYSGGSLRPLAVDGLEPQARGIDRRGRIVGSTWFEGSPPFVLANGVQTPLGTMPGQAEAINDRGLIVGWAETTFGGPHAFVSDGVTKTDLGTLGGASSRANAINKSGQVVGAADTATGASHAFIYQGGSMVDLNDLLEAGSGWVLESATGINDSGEIVGIGSRDGVERAFLSSPLR